MDQEKEQIKVEKQMLNMTYIGFWKRLGAYFIDFFVMLPVILISIKLQFHLKQIDSYVYLLCNVLMSAFIYFYRIFFNTKFGATPGKMACKIKITSEDGSSITLKQAFLRELVYFVYTACYYLFLGAAVIYMYKTSTVNNVGYIQDFYNHSIFSIFSTLLNYGICVAEFISFLTSPKKQALHDRIAKTVVVYK